MDIRALLNERPRLFAGITAVVLVICLGFAFLQAKHGGRPPLPNLPVNAFYTADDGATLFVDSMFKVPPIDHDGTKAVRARVFSCDGGKTQWIQFLEKYSDEDKRLLEGTDAPSRSTFCLVKRPGDHDWARETDPKGLAIMNPTPPNGSANGPVTPVMP